MAKDIVNKCAGCLFYSNMSHKSASALKTIPLIWPFAVWGLDMVGPFKTSRNGFTHLLVAVDEFTKRIEAKPIKNLDSSTAISFIKELISNMEFLTALSKITAPNLILMSSRRSVRPKALGSTMRPLHTCSRMGKQKGRIV